MSKKVYNLIIGIATGVESISVAVITFINPPAAVAINAAIPIVGTAVLAVCKLFVKEA